MRAVPDVVAFGTYDPVKNPRIAVLVEGLRAHGFVVEERFVPVGFDSKMRTRMLRRPWLLVLFVLRLIACWTKLWRSSRDLKSAPVVVVGWMGYLDVHLAKRRFKRATIVLDHLTSLVSTSGDRDAGDGSIRRMLARIDDGALRVSDVICVDTDEHLADVPQAFRAKALTVAVGAGDEWFRAPRRSEDDRLRVIFFGQYTPLQGGPVLGAALASADVDVTMIGDGQELETTRLAASAASRARWITWLTEPELRSALAAHDVCLGIFGATPKALAVVPNKVYQGAASGLAIVTSDTPPQRRALGDAAVFVPPGDASAIADALTSLANDPARVWALRVAASRRAEESFRPRAVVEPLAQLLRVRVS